MAAYSYKYLYIAAVELVDVKQKRVYFSGIDLIEATPVLDLKPLHPAEIMPDSLVRFPAWIQKPQNLLHVSWSEEARKQLELCCQNTKLEHFKDAKQVEVAATQSISLDPRTQHSKRKHHDLFGIT